jgi:hypothetical protein
MTEQSADLRPNLDADIHIPAANVRGVASLQNFHALDVSIMYRSGV